MDKLLTIKYWFNLAPGGWQDLRFFILGLAIFVVLMAIIMKIIAKRKNFTGIKAGLVNRLIVCFITVSFLELVLWFFREQRVPFFSARFWQLLLFLVMLTWLVFIIKRYFTRRPLEKEAQTKAIVYDKYLPKKK